VIPLATALDYMSTKAPAVVREPALA
jgi:hypothetical protein